MEFQYNGTAPERVDFFRKLRLSIPIPNLIEVQKKSYERFLQMDLLPNEREDIGKLQTVFNSVFSDLRFRRRQSDLRILSIMLHRQLGVCKCGKSSRGCTTSVPPAEIAVPPIRTDPFHAGDILCGHCGIPLNKNVGDVLQQSAAIR